MKSLVYVLIATDCYFLSKTFYFNCKVPVIVANEFSRKYMKIKPQQKYFLVKEKAKAKTINENALRF